MTRHDMIMNTDIGIARLSLRATIQEDNQEGFEWGREWGANDPTLPEGATRPSYPLLSLDGYLAGIDRQRPRPLSGRRDHGTGDTG